MSVGFSIQTPDEAHGRYGSLIEAATHRPTYPTDVGGFYDYRLQLHLLPFLRAEGLFVDAYDGGGFSGGALRELIENVEIGIATITAADEDWPGWSSAELDRYYTDGGNNGLQLKPPKQQALDELHRVLELANKALSGGNHLSFHGD